MFADFRLFSPLSPDLQDRSRETKNEGISNGTTVMDSRESSCHVTGCRYQLLVGTIPIPRNTKKPAPIPI
ncbi:MAG: hypothetical protein EHM79_17425 [Geobacter sp.]|nr:MAG: hypothetical protein EHM79_17425 [Geobacter sp.]